MTKDECLAHLQVLFNKAMQEGVYNLKETATFLDILLKLKNDEFSKEGVQKSPEGRTKKNPQ